LPPAFLRRCVIHSLEQPSEDRLVEIAAAHFPAGDGADNGLFQQVAKRVVSMRKDVADSTQPPPSTAEYLDAVRACLKFNIKPGESQLWNAISSAVLLKKTDMGGA
jgi:hypothetical protein